MKIFELLQNRFVIGGGGVAGIEGIHQIDLTPILAAATEVPDVATIEAFGKLIMQLALTLVSIWGIVKKRKPTK